MIPPQVAREGSKKTVFVNFKDMCKKMHRTMEHVMSYFNAELGVPCSLDPEGKLTFKGRFTPKQIESVVRKYMIAYVQCQMCKNFDSNLVKESATRLTFLECNRSAAPTPVSLSLQSAASEKKRDPKAHMKICVYACAGVERACRCRTSRRASTPQIAPIVRPRRRPSKL